MSSKKKIMCDAVKTMQARNAFRELTNHHGSMVRAWNNCGYFYQGNFDSVLGQILGRNARRIGNECQEMPLRMYHTIMNTRNQIDEDIEEVSGENVILTKQEVLDVVLRLIGDAGNTNTATNLLKKIA